MREIRISWQDDGPDSGWVCRIDGSIYEGGGHVGDVPEDLPRDAPPEAVVAAWLRSRQALGEPCLTCGQAAPERDQIVASMVGEGRPLREIGEAVGLSERQVTRIAQRAGIRRGRGRPAKPVETRGEAIAAGRYSVEGTADGRAILSICLGQTKRGPWSYVLVSAAEIDPVGAAAAGRGEEITAEQAAALIVAAADR